MSNFNFTSSITISSYIDNEEASLKSYNYLKYKSQSRIIFENNNNFKFGNTSNLYFYDSNDISQNIIANNENESEIYKNIFKPIFHIENDNKKGQTFNSLDNSEENINNKKLEDNSKNNINNTIEIKNTNIDNEDKKGNQNNNFKIFNNRDYDIYSNKMIDEALNNVKKKCKKIKRVSKKNKKRKKY